jgi:hypothetical protein
LPVFVSEGSGMRELLFVCLTISFLAILDGCKARRGAAITRDACSLITKEEVGSVQASPVTDTKSSERSDDLFRVAECFYTTTESNKSVNLAVVQQRADQQNKGSPKDFWKEKFDPYQNEESNTKSADEKEQGPAPKKIVGLGDDAYWVSNRFGGVLYVLKGDAFISIGLGGTDDEQTKLRKSKVLAQKALQRL